MTEQTHICPQCNQPLEHVRLLNPEIFGTDDKLNPWHGYVCRNINCKGWFCECCDEWHPHGTSCAAAMVRNVRGGNNYQEHDALVCVDNIKGEKHE